MSEDHHDNKFWFGFFVGGLIGAAIIVLLGTKEGRKIEQLLEKKGKEALDDFEEKVGDIKEKVEEKKEKLTEVVSEKLDETLSHIETLQEQGLQNTQKLRHAFKNLPKKR